LEVINYDSLLFLVLIFLWPFYLHGEGTSRPNRGHGLWFRELILSHFALSVEGFELGFVVGFGLACHVLVGDEDEVLNTGTFDLCFVKRR
jgi:hypothetical protein